METMNHDAENGRERDEAEACICAPKEPVYCLSGSFEDVVRMIRAGVDVNEKEERSGDALVHLAVRYMEAIPLLLEAGADVNMTDDTDLRAIDYARENPKLKDTAILQTIERAALD